MEGLRFANGVALGPRDEYLLLTETIGMLIHKVWLKGPKKGTSEIFMNALPGYPDNISYNDNGIFWLAMPNIRVDAEFEDLYTQPFLGKVISRLPRSIRESKEPGPYGIIIGIDTLGQVRYNFQDLVVKSMPLRAL
ncbi:MAG: hypothetical protein ACJA01_002283 [Saprospiraceae bacterium]|jgi:hypothetical protein